MQTEQHCDELVKQALQAKRAMSAHSGKERTEALLRMADHLDQKRESLKSENQKDLENGQKNGLASAMLDRLALTDQRIEGMISSVRQIAAQPDPLGRMLDGRSLPNGIKLQKMAVPIGTILIIFESRPNVTSDAAALCLKSGNSVILRGGKEALHSNQAIASCIQEALQDCGMHPGSVQLVQTTDREAVGILLKKQGEIDLAIPRGGESLIKAVVEQAHIPVIKHYTGNCHVYVDQHCDHEMAIDICLNSKTQRTGVCNSTETILIHAAHLESGLTQKISQSLTDKEVEIRACERTRSVYSSAKAAVDIDWATEYLDLIVAMKTVDSLDEAVSHINQYGSGHTDAIVTERLGAAEQFVQGVETANSFVNCSTRFSDGGEYGLGAEIGISTDKLHARGPMGAEDLTTYQWVAWGQGQVR